MKALSIRQPWAWAILNAGKRIENRDWRAAPVFRGEFLIHAAKGCTQSEYLDAARFIWRAAEIAAGSLPALKDLERGGIVARARLVGIRQNGCAPKDPWAIPDALGLVLADVEALPFVPLNGALGFFDVTPERVRLDPARGKDTAEHEAAVNSLLQFLSGDDFNGAIASDMALDADGVTV